MKKSFLIFLVLTLCAGNAFAQDFRYSVSSVTDCAMTSKTYQKFYDAGNFGVIIPGLKEGFVPQGITAVPGTNLLLFAGYRDDKDASALLAVDADKGELVKEVILRNKDGSVYNGHAGGVAATENDIYISNASHLYRISLDTFNALNASDVCAFEEAIPVPCNASFACYSEGILWVGEFEYGSNYKTDKTHHMKSPAKVQNTAWVCGYLPNEDNAFEAPAYILSVTERIQGITTDKGMIYLSQSYGRKNSSFIMKHDAVMIKDPDTYTALNGRQIPVWFLDKTTQISSLMAPPMTECLCTFDNGIYVLFESAANTYMNPSNPSVNPIDRVFRINTAE